MTYKRVAQVCQR